jgi:YidC/Oxa1 family membrane protein insertase
MGSDQKNALTAILLSGAILFGWQYFFGNNNTNFTNPEIAQTKAESSKVNNASIPDLQGQSETPVKKSEIPETSVNFSTNISSFKINNKLELTEVIDVSDSVSLEESIPKTSYKILFKMNEEFQTLNFDLYESNNSIKFENKTYGISGSIEPNQQGSAQFSINSSSPLLYRFVVKSNTEKVEDDSFLPVAGGSSEIKFMYNGADFETVALDGDNKGDEALKWFGIEGNFQLFATIFTKETIVKHKIEDKIFTVTTAAPSSNMSFKMIFTKKDYDNLLNIGDNLHLSLDFGIWAVIAVPILRGLQFFYSFFHNYGVAIIFLTIFIRLLTFPLQYKSFKSMKKMQTIQPEMAKLKEKFKNDPQRMQKETMALFKKSGANPLGGCLPMLLQMPIFFAFYRVLFSSVELVDAPFILWITDLSAKDPYYILPILMAVAMVLNQKMMPSTTTDPTQKKMMMFMPLIFVVFMKDFPAGLVLYTVVSTVMGMLQQLFVYKRT